MRERIGTRYDAHIRRGIHWLFNTYDARLGWIPNPNRAHQREEFPGLTAQVLHVLSMAEAPFNLNDQAQYREAKIHFLSRHDFITRSVIDNDRTPDSDVYLLSERSQTQLEPLTFLWLPWTVVVYKHLASDESLTSGQRKLASNGLGSLLRRYQEISYHVETGPTYILAEVLFGASAALPR